MPSLPWIVVLSLLAVACRSMPAELPPPAVGPTVRVPFAVDLGGWTSQAELVHPAPGGPHGNGPWPVVLLVCGNGPHDMDVTLRGPDGEVKLFAQIADVLAARGASVVRYHKRFVKAPGRFDARFWKEQSTVVFTADAGKVLDAALALPACDRERVFVYGWSEGTAVGAQLAIERGDIDGLVLQGAVGLSWRATVRSWIEDVGVPYAAGDDAARITSADLVAAARGKGGMVAKLGASFCMEPGPFGQPVRVSSRLDRDQDGEIDVATEVVPQLDAMVDFAFSPQGNTYIYAEGRTVPTVTDNAAKLTMPVLILQGANDASTPARGALALEQALVRGRACPAVTRIEIPGAGHTLGPAASLQDDHARAPAASVLEQVALWLRDRSR